MKKTIIIIAAALALTGCATVNTSGASGPLGGYAPIIDGGDAINIQADLYDCRQHAAKVSSGADRAVAGAIAGALIGGALNAALGVKGYGNEMAGFGAITGALEGAGAGARDQRSIVRNCMIGRGHRVLN